jgi:hypothetical protein
MKRLGCATVIVAAGLLTGCATMRVSSHTERGLVWSQYHTFEWGPADTLPAGDPRLEKDPNFQDRVAGAIEKQMAAKGFARAAPSQKPDLLIHYHATVTDRLDVDEIDRGNGYCVEAECRPRITRYEAGTLVVDIIDARSHRLIWRGWAQDSLDSVVGNRDRVRHTIDDGVTRMFVTLAQSK